MKVQAAVFKGFFHKVRSERTLTQRQMQHCRAVLYLYLYHDDSNKKLQNLDLCSQLFFFFFISKISNLARQMEPFLNPLDSHPSAKELMECNFGIEKPNFEVDSANYLSITFKPTN